MMFMMLFSDERHCTVFPCGAACCTAKIQSCYTRIIGNVRGNENTKMMEAGVCATYCF